MPRIAVRDTATVMATDPVSSLQKLERVRKRVARCLVWWER